MNQPCPAALDNDSREATKGDPIQHGIGFRFRVPYRSPTLLDVAVNGHTLTESATDGYQALACWIV